MDLIPNTAGLACSAVSSPAEAAIGATAAKWRSVRRAAVATVGTLHIASMRLHYLV